MVGEDEPEQVAEPPQPDPGLERQAGFAEEETPPPDGGAPDGGAANIAGQFLRNAYFLRLHHFAGDAESHPTRAKWCFVADYVLRLIAALIIMGIAIVVAWKALSPLPWDVHDG